MPPEVCYFMFVPGAHSTQPESFHVGGHQDPQQVVAFILIVVNQLTIEYLTSSPHPPKSKTCSPSILLLALPLRPCLIQPPAMRYTSFDDDTPYSHMQKGLPPISVDIPIATSPIDTRGPPSSATAPHSLISPGLVSPSQAAYASSPSQLAPTPSTPLHSLDTYSPYTHSAPISPYLTQHSPWLTSHPVRYSSICSAFVPLTSSRS